MPSRVLDDALHFMDCLLRLLPKMHSAFDAFCADFSRAIFLQDKDDKSNVRRVLKAKELTRNMPNMPNQMSSTAKFGDSFQHQTFSHHDYKSYSTATRISSVQINKIKDGLSFPKMLVTWPHDFSILHDSVFYQIQLVFRCIIKWDSTRMA